MANTKQYDEFKGELEKAMTEMVATMSGHLEKIGKILLKVENAFLKSLGLDGKKEYARLTAEIGAEFGWGQSEFDAARLIAEGKIDAKLFVAGVKCSKILNLTKEEGKRLLSIEKFGLKQPDNSIVHKPWGEMNAAEKNQLLGPKGGKILPPKDQKLPVVSSNKVMVNITDISYDQKNHILVLIGGNKRVEVPVSQMVENMSVDDLTTFVADLQQQQVVAA